MKVTTEMILAIVGSRVYRDSVKFDRVVSEFIRENGVPDEIVSGGATGADTLAEKYAERHNIPFVVYRANWALHGKSAGPMRNTQIVEHCTHLLAFPLGESIGTMDTVRKADKAGRVVRLV